MLKKLASPKKRARQADGASSFDAPDAAGLGSGPAQGSTVRSTSGKAKKEKDVKAKEEREIAKMKEKEEAKAKEQERIKAKELEKSKAKEAERAKKEKLKEEKTKEKAKKKEAKKGSNTDVFGMGSDAAAPTEVLSDEAKEANGLVVTNEAKTPSPRKSIARAFKRRSLFEDNPEDKSPTKASPTKKLSSPKKSLMKLPKPERKSKLATKKQETKPEEELVDSNTQAAAAETKPLTPTKPDAPVESPTRRKSRWKMNVPDIKHHKSLKTSNNQKEQIHEEEKAPKTSKMSPTASRDTSPRDRDKRAKSKRELPLVESFSGESEGENHTNVLSPLRRHKPDPDDTLPIPESPHKAYLMQKRMAQLDVPPVYQPEVHLVGEIVSGQGFGVGFGLCCKWRVEYGSRWSLIAGDQSGHTQVDYPPSAPWGSSDVAVWSHPIDLHFATTAFQGWPKLIFQVYRVDSSRKLHTVGYGFVPVPFAAGQHELSVSLWRPLGTMKEELDALILGQMPELKNDDVLFNAAWSERCRLRTISTGKVLVHVGVLLRHFQPGVIVA